MKKSYAICLAFMIAAFLAAMPAQADTGAYLNVQGQGMAANQAVTLSTGPNQKISAQTAADGSVTFSKLRYTPTSNLVFALSYIVKGGLKTVPNNLLVSLDPFTGFVSLKGSATRAASIVLSVAGENSAAIIANQDGYFSGAAETSSGFDQGNFRIIASVINVEEGCCPRSFKPYAPVTVTISATPDTASPDTATPVEAKKAELPLIRFEETAHVEMMSQEPAFAVSVPADLINKSWVAGIKTFTQTIVHSIQNQTTSLGAFLEGQNNINARQSLQRSAARSAINYLPSEQLCRFGTLSQSLGSSEALGAANKVAMSKTLLDAELGTVNTPNGNPQNILRQRLNNFYATSCDKTDGNTALAKNCKNNNNSDRLNKDVDYTAAVDAPLTIPLDIGSDTPQNQDMIALSENLFPSVQQSMRADNPNYLENSKSFYSLQALRSVAKNSFISLLSEKAQGTAGSAEFIKRLLQSMKISDPQVLKLMGDKPSYYAQMEMLTKKLYQTPAFYVNLIDTPANVARQRTAIRAVKLQQQNDFAAVVKRREMLLATLLELKLRERSRTVNQRIVTPGQTPAPAAN